MKRITLVATATLMFVLVIAQAAMAGEWGPGNGYNGASSNANSECVFNGRDDIDPEDDFIWENTPAGGKVQSGGQMIAALKQGVDLGLPPEATPFPGVQRFACNGHLSPLK